MIEDSRNGVRAAKSAGMYCIGFRNGDNGDQDLSEADAVVSDLQEVKAMLSKQLLSSVSH